LIRFLFYQCDKFEYFDVTTHEYDVIELRDVIDNVINRRAMPKSLSFRDS